MLVDVFGREFPEKEFWDVDQEAVLAYKIKVANNVAKLKLRIAALL